MFTENSTQLDIVFDDVETRELFPNARLGAELVTVALEPKHPFSLSVSHSLDDEYTPGVFKVWNERKLSKFTTWPFFFLFSWIVDRNSVVAAFFAMASCLLHFDSTRYWRFYRTGLLGCYRHGYQPFGKQFSQLDAHWRRVGVSTRSRFQYLFWNDWRWLL